MKITSASAMALGAILTASSFAAPHPENDARATQIIQQLKLRPLVAVPGGCWKALRLHEGASYALIANVLSPEFTPDRVKIGAGDDWLAKYTGSSPWATRETLRAFIGPNWTGK